MNLCLKAVCQIRTLILPALLALLCLPACEQQPPPPQPAQSAAPPPQEQASPPRQVVIHPPAQPSTQPIPESAEYTTRGLLIDILPPQGENQYPIYVIRNQSIAGFPTDYGGPGLDPHPLSFLPAEEATIPEGLAPRQPVSFTFRSTFSPEGQETSRYLLQAAPLPANTELNFSPLPRSYRARGIVTALPGQAGDYLKVHHETIPKFIGAEGAMGMHEMTMPFPLAKGMPLPPIEVGDKVQFYFTVEYHEGFAPAAYYIIKLEKLPPDTPLNFEKAE